MSAILALPSRNSDPTNAIFVSPSTFITAVDMPSASLTGAVPSKSMGS